jgi:hypothetical protein
MVVSRSNSTVFRHNVMAGVAIAGSIIFALIFLGVALSAIHQEDNIVAVAVGSVCLWWLWVAGWWSKVEFSNDGVTLDSLFIRRMIPWNQLRDIEADGGLKFRLNDGTGFGTISYGGSVLGALSGYSGMKRVRDEMLSVSDQYKEVVSSQDDPTPNSRQVTTRVKVVWWPLLAYAGVFEAIAIGIDLAKRTL